MKSKDFLNDEWSQKYKKSINCSNPRGFSQRAHCAGRKKNEDVAQGLINELAPGGGSGNGPFDYGAAIIKIGEDFLDHFTDSQAGEDAAQITKAGETFIAKGMLAGVKFLYQELDTQVRDHVFDELADQGFNVEQDLIALRRKIPRDPEAGQLFAKMKADWEAQPGHTYVVTGQWGTGSSTSKDIKAGSEQEARQKFLASNKGVKFNSIDVKRLGGAAGMAEGVNAKQVKNVQENKINRRGFLAGMLGLAAAGMVPQSVASELVQQLADPAAASDTLERAAGNLLNAIRWRLEQFRSDKLRDRAVANIAGKLGMPTDQFEEFMEFYEYGSDPEEAAKQLVQHLRGADPRSITVRDRDFDDHDDDDNAVAQAAKTVTSTAARTQAAPAVATGMAAFKDLLQRVMSDRRTEQPQVKDMGQISRTGSAPALPAPDQSAVEIMAQLRDIVGRDLSDAEKDLARQKLQGVAEGILGNREYNRVMPVVKRIAGEVSDYDRDEFGEELWSLLDQKYGSKYAQSILQDSLDFYWDEYTELTGQQGMAEGLLNEFDPGEGGFGPFKVYIGKQIVKQFSTFEEAKDEVDFLRDSDPRSANDHWRIVDGTGQTAWEYDIGHKIDSHRRSQKFRGQGMSEQQGVAEGSDNIWGPAGRFAGDEKTDIGMTLDKIAVGDQVQYHGRKVQVKQLYKDRARVSDRSREWDVRLSDLNRLGQGVREGSLNEVDRRGFLRGLAAFAAVSAVPSGVVRALSTPEGINTLTTNDVNALLKAIRAYLPRYDQQDWTGTFERWDKMASVLRIYGDDDELGSDKLDKLMGLYRKDPEQASTKLLQHLQKHAVDLTDVRKQTISQWDDIETVRRSDPVNDEIRQMQQQIADYNARMQLSKTPGISPAQTATAAVTQFRDLVQQMLGAETTISRPPREKYMGRIKPTSSALALPAPDRSATEIMRDLQDIMDRPLTDQEKTIVQQALQGAK